QETGMPRWAALSCAASFFAVLSLMSPTSVGAQTSAELASGGMDLHLFRPAVDSKGFISVNGTDILGDGDFSFGLILDAGLGILPFNGFVNDATVLAADAEDVDRIVDQFFTGTFHFNYGIG